MNQSSIQSAQTGSSDGRIPGALVSAQWLARELGRSDVIVLDASMVDPAGAGAGQARQYIPGARVFDFSHVICDQASTLPNTMPSAEVFQCEVRKLGVNRDSCVVIYDSVGLYSAPRGWWMFRAMGFDNVHVLEGGLPAWRSAAQALVDQPVIGVEAGDFVATPREGYFCDADAVMTAIESGDAFVVDARSPARFSGAEKEPRVGMRSGHIPGSMNLYYASLSEGQNMLTPEKLRQRFAELLPAGDPQRPMIFTCGSGVTACALSLAAHLSGYNDVTVYDGSWSEWGAREDLPIATSSA